MHACIHAYTHTCIHTYTHTYIHTYIHAHIHTYIHTYMPVGPGLRPCHPDRTGAARSHGPPASMGEPPVF